MGSGFVGGASEEEGAGKERGGKMVGFMGISNYH